VRIVLTRGHRNTGFWLTRWLGAAGHQVTVTDSHALAFGLKSRYSHAYEWLPEPSAPEYADRLVALVRRLRPDVLFPVGDVVAASARRDDLARETAVLMAHPDAYQVLLDKSSAYELCGRFGIGHPRVLGTDLESVAEHIPDRRDGSPLAVIKPRRDVGGGQGIVFLAKREDLEDAWQRRSQVFGPLIATEYVKGPVHAQYAVQFLFDRKSELIEFFVLQKLRQWPAGSGITVAAKSIRDLSLVPRLVPLFQHLRWQGPVEVELKRDTDRGDWKVLEINPRFSGTVAFSLMAGVDIPGSMVAASQGQSRPRAIEPYYPGGLHYWSPFPWTRSVLSDLGRRDGIRDGLRDLAMPLLKRPVGNPYSLSDPSALVGKVGFQVAEALRRRLSTRGGRPPD
jgi:carbamoylphosphate synthase large subunit